MTEPTTFPELLCWVTEREAAWKNERDGADEDLFPYANGMATAYYCVRARLTAILDGRQHVAGDPIPRVTPEEKREAHRIAVALEPGEYDSDDLDRIQTAYEQRMREFEKVWETYP